MKILALLAETMRRFREAGIPEAHIEAEILLGSVLKMGRPQLFLAAGNDFPAELHADFEKLVERRLAREPLAYILGEQEFWSLPFRVTRDVLIPRPETERLLELAIERARGISPGFRGPILDLGTGSGVIAVVLASELKDVLVWSVDRSFAALRIAAENAKRHGVEERVRFLCADWMDALNPKPVFGLIVSNPPYVAVEELFALMPEVRDYEPRLALDGGGDGMASIKIIATHAIPLLIPGGWLFMEIGAGQAGWVMDLFSSLPGYENVRVHADYAGLPRVLEVQRLAV